MSKYSDSLPSFGRNRHRSDDKGQARFDHFLRNARLRRQKPKPRPGVKIIVMVIAIMALGWGIQERNTLFALVAGERSRVRTIVPLAIPMGEGEAPAYSSELIQQRIAEVTPRAQACVLAWPGAQRDSAGKIEVEVVLGSGGAEEGAIYGQPDLPEPVARCIGDALGSRRWPVPPWNRKVRFAVVGGSL